MCVEMDGKAFGKLLRDGNAVVVSWHSLIDHMTDVAACFNRMSNCHSIRRALDVSATRILTETDIARLSVLAFLHDVGKANSGFQAKRWKHEADIPTTWPVRIHAGHGAEVFRLFAERSADDAFAPLSNQLCTWGDSCNCLLIASVSHHGRPVKDGPGTNRNIWKSITSDYDPATVLQEIAVRAPVLYPQAFSLGGEPLPDAPAFAHLFAGLVQLADWLGSDTRFFPFTQLGEDRAITAPGRATEAIATIGLDADDWRNALVASAPSFMSTFDVAAARPIQAAIRAIAYTAFINLGLPRC